MVRFQTSGDRKRVESEGEKVKHGNVRTHAKVLQGNSVAVITKKINEFIDIMYEMDHDLEVVSVDTDITPGNWSNAIIVFNSCVIDPSGNYDVGTMKDMAEIQNT